jgi:hypothetical protein
MIMIGPETESSPATLFIIITSYTLALYITYITTLIRNTDPLLSPITHHFYFTFHLLTTHISTSFINILPLQLSTIPVFE